MPSREEIENKFFVAGQMDAQGHAAEKMKIGSGGTVLAMSWRFLSEARSLMDEFESEIAALRAENERLFKELAYHVDQRQQLEEMNEQAEAQLTALQAEQAQWQQK